jgi:hypothetical protein
MWRDTFRRATKKIYRTSGLLAQLPAKLTSDSPYDHVKRISECCTADKLSGAKYREAWKVLDSFSIHSAEHEVEAGYYALYCLTWPLQAGEIAIYENPDVLKLFSHPCDAVRFVAVMVCRDILENGGQLALQIHAALEEVASTDTHPTVWAMASLILIQEDENSLDIVRWKSFLSALSLSDSTFFETEIGVEIEPFFRNLSSGFLFQNIPPSTRVKAASILRGFQDFLAQKHRIYCNAVIAVLEGEMEPLSPIDLQMVVVPTEPVYCFASPASFH